MGMGRPKATLVLDSELREQLESLAQLAFSSGGIGASGQDYLVERMWEDEPRDCPATGDEHEHGRPVAATVSRARGVRTLRRVTSGPPPPD